MVAEIVALGGTKARAADASRETFAGPVVANRLTSGVTAAKLG